MKKAIFIDRDGVLIQNVPTLSKWEQVKVIPDVASYVETLKERGFMIFIISTQSSVAQGLISEEEMKTLHLRILEKLAISEHVTKSYLCFHHPAAKVEKYRQVCQCHKPKNGFVMEAKKDFKFDLNQSFLIGDQISDVVCANISGLKSILMDGPAAKEKLEDMGLKIAPEKLKPGFVTTAFDEAVEWILNQSAS